MLSGSFVTKPLSLDMIMGMGAEHISGRYGVLWLNLINHLCATAEADPSSQHSVRDDSWEHARKLGPCCRIA